MTMLRQQIRKVVPPSLRPYLGALRRKIAAHPWRISRQKRKLLQAPELRPEQRAMLQQVRSEIHHRDGMYYGIGAHYFLAGLSAVECVDDVLSHASPEQIRSILDMPSGYGRELRFLALRFPAATITACDIQPEAVDFCARTFGARVAYSHPDLRQVSFDRDFDLIWCGSLVTHLDKDSTLALLRLFARHLTPGGIAIFTTNGEYVCERMSREGATYELRPETVAALTASYAQTGYGYGDYPRGLGYFDFHPDGSGYGVSVMSPAWVRRQVGQAVALREVYFKARGWANHQDVFAFMKPAD